MSTDSWTSVDGTWSTGADWDLNHPPGTLDTAVLGSLLPYTVTHAAGTDVVAGINATTDALVVTGGTLSVTGIASFAAGLTVSGGALTLGGNTTASGTTDLGSGVITIGPAATLALSGPVSWDQHGNAAVDGPGTLATSGTTTITGGGAGLGNGLSWEISGTVFAAAGIYLDYPSGTGTVAITNASGGMFDLAVDGNVFVGSGLSAGFINAGLLGKTGGSGTSTFNAAIFNTGTINVASGTLELDGGGTLGGTLEGVGVLALGGGGTFTASGLAIGDHGLSLLVDGGSLDLSGNNTIAAFTMTSGQILLASDTTLSLTNASFGQYNGGNVDGPGTLATSGTTTVADYYGNTELTLGGGVTWTNSGTVEDGGRISAGDNTGTTAAFVNQAGATFDLTSDDAQIATSYDGSVGQYGSSTFDNAGTLAKTGGTGTSHVYSDVTNTGTINVASGTLELDGGGTLGGTLEGAGTLDLGSGTFDIAGLEYGSGVPTILIVGGAIDIASGTTAEISTNASFGQYNGGNVDGPGTLATSGTTTVADYYGNTELTLGGGVTWTNSGTVEDGGRISAGDNTGTTAAFVNQAGATFDLTSDDAQIATSYDGSVGQYGSSTFDNAGTLAKTGGTGTSHVYSDVTNTGTINVASGTLELDGGGTLGGTLEGVGVLALGGGGTFTASGLAIGDHGLSLLVDGGSLDLSGNNTIAAFTMTSGQILLASDTTLSLTNASFGQYNGGNVDGPGTLATSGTTTVADYYGNTELTLGGGVTWTNSGTVEDGGRISAGDNTGTTAAFVNQAGATFDLTSDDAQIATSYDGSVGQYGSSTFDNAGTLAKTGGTGTSHVYSDVTNTGTINVASGTLELDGGGTLGGTLEGVGVLALGGGGTFTASGLAIGDHGLSLLVDGGSLDLSGNNTIAAFTMTSGQILLASDTTLSLTNASFGQYNGGNVDGPGTLATSGTTTVADYYGNTELTLGGGVTWTNSGTVEDGGRISAGDNTGTTAAFVNQAGATFDLTSDDAQIATSYDGSVGQYGSSTFDNAGTLAKTGGTGTSHVYSDVTNTGTINVASGTLELDGGGTLGGTLEGVGVLALGGGGTFTASGLAIGDHGLSLLVDGGSLDLSGNNTIAAFTMTSGQILLASDTTLSLTNASFGQYNGGNVDGPGTLATSGTTTVADYYGNTELTLGGGVTWTNSGTVEDGGRISAGDNTGTTAAFVNQAGATFDLTSDDAQIATSYDGSVGQYGSSTFDNAGTLAKTGGTGTSHVYSDVTNTGTINVASGTLELDGGGTLGGTLEGAGTLDLGSGTFDIAGLEYGSGVPTILIVGGAIDIASGTTAEISTNASFGQYNGGNVDGPGTLATSGTTTVADYYGNTELTLGGGVTWTNSGTVEDGGRISAGDNTGTTAAFVNQAGATFDLTSDDAQIATSYDGSVGQYGSSTFDNAGTLAKTGGTGTSHVYSDVTNTGTINVASGTLELDGGGTLGGTLEGVGVLALGGGGTFTASGLAIGDHGLSLLVDGGSLDLSGNNTIAAFTMTSGQILLASDTTLSLTNASFGQYNGGNVDGPGTLATSGTTTVADYYGNTELTLGGGVTWTNSGTVEDGGRISAGDNTGTTAAFVNQAGATFDLTSDDAQIATSYDGSVGQYGSSTFDNAGTLAKTGGTGTSHVYSDVTNTGTINVASGTLELDGGGTLGGTLEGVGVLALGGGGTFTASGLAIGDHGLSLLVDGGSLDLSGNNTIAAFTMTSGQILLASDTTLSLTNASFGQYNGGNVDGPGTLATSGTTTVADYYGNTELTLGGGVTWTNSGTVEDGGRISAGDNTGTTAAFVNQAGATFDLTSDDAQIATSYDGSVGQYGSSTFDNAGTLAKTGGTGTSHVYSDVTNTGTINVASGTLELDGGGTLGGTLEGVGVLALGGGGTFTASGLAIGDHGLSLLVDGGSLDLSGNNTIAAFTMTSGQILLASDTTLSLTNASFGQYNGGNVDGPGTLATSGTTTVADYYGNTELTLGGGVTWTNSGTVEDGGRISAGDNTGTTAAFVNQAGATFDLTSDDAQIATSYDGSVGQYGSSTFDNAGTLAKTGGTGTSHVYSDVTNTGTINVASGTLELDGGGTLGGTLEGAGTLDLGSGTFDITGLTFGSGAPTILIDGGTVIGSGGTLTNGTITGTNAIAVSGGTLELGGTTETVPSLSLTNQGDLDGSGTVTVTGATSVFNGAMSGSGLTVAQGSSSLPSLILRNGRTFENQGTATVSSSYDIFGGYGSIVFGYTTGGTNSFVNDAGAVLNEQIDGTLAYNYRGTSSITNAGLIDKTGGTGTSYIDVYVTNTGTLEADTGTLEFDGGGSSSASDLVTTGSGALAFGGNSSFTITGGSFADLKSLSVTGGTVDLTGAVTDLTAPVSITGGTLELGTNDVTLPSLTLGNDGDLDGTGTVTVTGTLSVSYNSTLSGGGLIVAEGPSTLDGLDLTGGETFENQGTATVDSTSHYFAGAINFGAYAGGTNSFVNDAGAVLNEQIDGTLAYNYRGTSSITNAGLIDKTGGTGTSYIDVYVTNTGTLEADTGTLEFDGGGSSSASDLVTTGSGALAFGGNSSFTITGGSFADLKSLSVTGGTVDLTGAVTDLTAPVSITGGTLELGTNDVTLPSLTLGNDGDLDGTGTVTVTGTLSVSYNSTLSGGGLIVAEGPSTLDGLDLTGGETFENQGTATVDSTSHYFAGAINFGAYAGGTNSFVNDAGAVLNEQIDGTLAYNYRGTSSITNAGLIDKTGGTGTSYIDVYVTNTGTLEADTGTLEFDGGGSSSASDLVTTGSGALAFGGNSSFTITGGSFADLKSLSVTSGTVDLTGAVTDLTAPVSITGGTLELGTNDVTLPSLTLGNDGDLDGTGTVTVTGTLSVSYNSTLSGGGLIVAEGPSTLDGLDLTGGETFENQGTATVDSTSHYFAGAINFGAYAGGTNSFVNEAGAVLNEQIDGTLTYNYRGTSSITNAGLIDKTGGTGTSYIDVYVTNTGTLEADTGTLEFDGGGSSSASDLVTTGNGALAFGGGTFAITGGSFANLGPLSLLGGTLEVDANVTLASLTIGGGDLNGTGTVTVTGTLSVPYDGTMSGSGLTVAQRFSALEGLALTGGRTFENQGTATFSSFAYYGFGIGFGYTTGGTNRFVNDAGAVLEAEIDGTLAYNYNGTNSITNAGLIEKTGGTGTSGIQVTLISTGTLDIATGTLELDGGGTLGGTLEGPGALVLDGGASTTLALQSGPIDNQVIQENGTLALSQDASIDGSFAQSGGLIDLAGHTLTLAGPATFNGGTIDPSSPVTGTLLTTGTVTLENATVSGGAVWANTGTIADSGQLSLDGGTLDNQSGGVFDVTTDNAAIVADTNGLFVNAGLFQTPGGTGTTTVRAAFDNTGTLDIAGDTLNLADGGTLSGSITGAGTLEISGSTPLDLAGVTDSGNTVVLQGGTLLLEQNTTLSGAFIDNGGKIDLNGYTLTVTGAVTLNGSEIFGSNVLTLDGGNVLGGGDLVTTGSVDVTSSGVSLDGGAVWTNQGNVQDAGQIAFTGPGTIANAAAATFDLADDAADVTGGGEFDNAGLLAKTGGTGTSRIQALLVNTGSVQVQTGTLALLGGGTSSGDGLTPEAGATLAFAGGDFTITGGTIAGAGKAALTGGTLDFGTFDAAIAAAFIQSGGDLTGSGTVDIRQAALLLGGLEDGTGDTVLEQGGTINGYIELDGGRTLTNLGTVTFLGGSTVAMGQGGPGPLHGATIDNLAGALWDTISDPTLISNGQGTNTFNNYGVFKKELTPGTAEVQVNFFNYGTLINNDGLLSFNGQVPVLGTVMSGPSSYWGFNPPPEPTLPSYPGGGGGTYETPDPISIGGGGDGVWTQGTLIIGPPPTLTLANPIYFSNVGTLDVEALTATTTATINIGDLIVQYMPNTDILTAGTWIIGNNGTLIFSTPPSLLPIQTNDADVTLKTTTSSFDIIDQLATNDGAFRILLDRDFTTTGDFTDNGLLQLGGGIFSTGAHDFIENAAGTVEGYGTLTGASVTLDGLVEASGGVLDISGAGLAQPAPLLTVDGADGGTLALGASNIDVSGVFTNTGWGVGNAFDARADVTGSGKIIGVGAGMAIEGVNGTAITTDAAGDIILDLGTYTPGSVVTLSFVITNTGAAGAAAISGAIQTELNGGAITSSAISGSGVTAQNFGPIAAGQQSQVFTISIDTTNGAPQGQAIHIASDFDNVPGITVDIGTPVGALASPSQVQPNPVNFGNAHVGDGVQQTLTIANTATAAGAQSLEAAIGGAAGDITASGSISGLAPGASDSTSLVVGLDTATAGAKSGSATIMLDSVAGVLATPLTAQTVSATGAVWRLATAALPATLDLGATRVGDVDTTDLEIANSAANDGYSEGLGYAVAAANGDFTVGGTLSGVVPAGKHAMPSITLGTDAAGTIDGSIAVTLDSDGVNTSGLGITELGTQTVQLAGTVYATAVASFSTQTVDFGILHVGQDGTATLGVTNTATGALTDVLEGDLAIATAGPFSGSGSLGAGLAAGQSGSFSFDFAGQRAVGTYDASLPFDFTSHDNAQADVSALGAGNIDLVGTVENYATAALEKVSGTGILSQDGDSYTLDLGSVAQGAAPLSVGFGVLNTGLGLADLLSGSFSVSGASEFSNAGLGAFSEIAAGGADTAPTATLSTDRAGIFTEILTLASTGSNASGYSGALAQETLTISGTVSLLVPVITAPADLTAAQGVPTQVSAISVAEPGNIAGETFTVTLSDSNGMLSATGTGVSGSGSTEVTITGTLAQVNADLATLSDTSTITGSDTIHIHVADSLNNVTDGTIGITVAPFSWKAAVSGDWSTPDDWTSGTVPGATDDVTIAATGTAYTVAISDTEAANQLLLNAADATLDVTGSLALGGTLSLAAGTLDMESTGVISGGTIAITGGSLVGNGGTWDGVTVEGAQTLAGTFAALTIENGITLIGAGTVDLTGSALDILGDTTLNNATISLDHASLASLADYESGFVSSVLTLGSHLDVLDTGPGAYITGNGNRGSLILNQGTIDAAVSGGQFNIQDRDVTNAGTIEISNGDTLEIDAEVIENSGVIQVGDASLLTIDATAFENSGLVTITDAAAVALNAAFFDNTGTVTQTGGTLTLAGSGLSTAQLGTLLHSGGALLITGALDNTNETLNLGAGTDLGAVTLEGGTITGGTIVDPAGEGLVIAEGLTGGPTLDGVTYQGTLDVGDIYPARLTIVDGITLAGADGTGPGTVNVSGIVTVDDTTTLDNATIQLVGSYNPSPGDETYARLSSQDTTGNGAILTLGPDLTLTGSYAELQGGTLAGDGIVNQGTIISDGGTFSLTGASFTNTGSVLVESGGLFGLDTDGFTNAGLIEVQSGGELDLGGTFTTAQLDSITNDGGSIFLFGVLDNTGTTLDVGPDSPLGTVSLGEFFVGAGTIRSGVISGGGLVVNGGVLDGVTYEGTVTPIYDLEIRDGITLEGADGTGPGEIDLTTSGGELFVDDSTTLDHATILIGDATLQAEDFSAPGAVLTLGSLLVLTQTAGTSTLEDSGAAGDGVVNLGSIGAAASGGAFNVLGNSFTNLGSIGVAGGDVFSIQSSHFANLVGGTLTGGSYEVDAGSTLELGTDAAIATDDADITLSGAGSTIEALSSSTNAEVLLDDTLTTIGATGALQLIERDFTTAAGFTNNGQLELADSVFTAASLVNAAGATLSGLGTIDAGLTNDGSVVAEFADGGFGTLKLAGAVSGTGDFNIYSVMTLEFGASVAAGQTISFDGAPTTLRLDDPSGFQGVIADFYESGTIDLSGITGVPEARINDDTLTVSLAGGGSLTLALEAGTYGGLLTVGSDGDGGTDITERDVAVPAPHMPTYYDLGAAHVGDLVNRPLDLTNIGGPFSAALDATIGDATSGVTASGTASIAAGATDGSNLLIGLDTSTAGAKFGTATITLASAGSAVDSLGTTALGTEGVQIVGTVYALAQAAFSGTARILHVGDTGTESLTVRNVSGDGAYSEGLIATGESTIGQGLFGASGTTGLIADGGQDSSAVTYTVDTSAAGFVSGLVDVALVSDGTGTSGLGQTSLGYAQVEVQDTIDNYATAEIEQIGGVGGLTHSGTEYTLNLGVLAAGSGPVTAGLGVVNTASGPADSLSGGFSVTGGVGFTNAGLAAFSGLAAGEADTAPSVTLSTAQVGTFSETITLDATGSNASGYSGSLAPETLTIIGTIAPASAALTILGTQAAQATTDQTAIDPFANVTIAETGSVTETATVTLSTTADGTLSQLGGGSYDTTTGVYTVSGAADDVTAALDGLVFTPTAFQAAPGASVTTGFDLSVTSSSGATASDDTTSVVATAAAVWNIAAGATLEIPGASHGQTIDFQGTAGLLLLDQPGLTTLTISGFTSGDHIDLAGVSPSATPVLAGGTLTIGTLHLAFTGDYTGEVLALVAAADGDAELTVATQTTVSGRQVVNLGSGDSNATASGYANRITGSGAGDNVVTVTSGLNNSVHLGDGNNVVTTGSNTASSSITLGDGSNQVNLGGTLQTVKLGNGADSVAMSGSNNTITAGNGADSVTGGTGNSSVTLGGGADSVALGGWVNSVTVGDGNDTVDAGAGSATIHLGQGNDTVVLHGRNNVVTGGNGTDSVTGGGLADTVSLGNGDDTVALGGALNVITLGDGHNTVTAGSGQDRVTVGGGANSITLAGPNNVVVGGNGADSVTGTGSYQDSVTLGDGADTVHLDGDHNTIHLGNGADSVTLGGQGNTVTAGNGGVSVTGGGAGNNHVSVGTGGNTVQLGGWGNSVSLGGGTSTVDAGLGSSTIQVAGGDVSLTLHGRADMVFLHNAAQASITDGSAGLKLGIDSGNVVASITGFGASSGAVLDLAGAGFASVAQVLAGLHSDGHGGTALALGGTGSVEFQNLAPTALHAGNFSVV